MWVYLRTKFQVSSIILTSFRWGGIEPLESPPRLGLNKKHSVGWFLLKRFVDLFRVCSLHLYILLVETIPTRFC